MLPSHPGSPRRVPRDGRPWEPLGREEGMHGGCASRSSECRILARTGCRTRIVEEETSAGNEGLVKLGANWWDLMGMTRMEWERNCRESG